MSSRFEGVYSVLPTPFDANGDLDEGSLRRVIDLFIGAGVNGVTALASPATRQPGPVLDPGTRQALDRVLQWVSAQAGERWISV